MFIDGGSDDFPNTVIIVESDFHSNSNRTLQVISLMLNLTICKFIMINSTSDDRAVSVSLNGDSYNYFSMPHFCQQQKWWSYSYYTTRALKN